MKWNKLNERLQVSHYTCFLNETYITQKWRLRSARTNGNKSWIKLKEFLQPQVTRQEHLRQTENRSSRTRCLSWTDWPTCCRVLFLVRFPACWSALEPNNGALTSRLPPHTAALPPSECESVCVRGWTHNIVKCFSVLSAQRLSINAVHVPFTTTPLHTQTITSSPGRLRVKCLAWRHLNSRYVWREVCSLDHQDRRRRPSIRAPPLNTIARNIESCRFSLRSSRFPGAENFRLLQSTDSSTRIVFRTICLQLLQHI